jgi:hypothetical protein
MTDHESDARPANATTDGPADKASGPVNAGGRRPQNGPPRDRRRGGERHEGPGGRRPEREGTFPFELTTIRLHHGASVTAFDRSFDRYRTSFYHVTAVLQRLNLDDGIDLIQEYLEKAVGEALAAIREGKRIVLAALEARTGSKTYKVMVPRPEEREARVPSYTCRQYLEVFRELDDYLNAVVYAESVGAITWRDRRTLFVNAPRQATSVAGRFQNVATRLSVHDLQQAASAFDALKAIVAQSYEEPPVSEERSLAIGQSGEVAAVSVASAASAAPAAVVVAPEQALGAPPQDVAPAGTVEPNGTAEPEARRRRKGGNGHANPLAAAAPTEPGADPTWA